MSTARIKDPNGFLRVPGCPISSYGIFDYSAAQCGMPGDPNRIVKVFRPESAISDADTIKSFEDVPFIVEHEMLSGDDEDEFASAPEDKGVDGVLRDVRYDAPWMRGNLVIYSRKAQKALKYMRDLSLGYSCDFQISPGVFNGEPYEAIQTNLRGNHIALVGEGRVPGARVLDGLIFDHLSFDVVPSSKGNEMAKNAGGKSPSAKPTRKAACDNAVAELKALLPALEKYLSEEATEPAHHGDEGNELEVKELVDPASAIEGAEKSDDLGEMIAKVEGILQQVKATMAQPEAASDEGPEGERPTEAKDADGTGENSSTDKPAADEGSPAEQGKASAGPAAGEHAGTQDSAIKRFYADSAVKGSLYDRLSKVVGSFDCRVMDSAGVAAYGVAKLGLKNVPKGQEMYALDAYLTGREAAERATRKQVSTERQSMDSKVPASSELDAYLKGE